MRVRFEVALAMVFFLNFFPAMAANLSDVQVANGASKATVTLSFDGQPIYAFFSLAKPDRVVLDIRQSGIVQGLPLDFNGQNILKRIRPSKPKDKQSLRLVLELAHPAITRAATRKQGGSYRVVFTIVNTETTNRSSKPPASGKGSLAPSTLSSARDKANNPFIGSGVTSVTRGDTRTKPGSVKRAGISDTVIVAIDAGHGGQDPGAIGAGGLKEKDVTIAIARKLRQLLNNDPMFKAILTRDGDYFISVMGRSDVARKQNANLLVSIHADAAPNRTATGSSVWVLSNRRANSEMAGWLEQHEKQSELLGGAGDMLAGGQADPYLSQAVLDLQFGHSQRVGYDAALQIIAQLKRVGSLHKRHPEHASLGVLRSPDIPSLLVETGFISNRAEEGLLGSQVFQQKIAESIYRGLHQYFLSNPLQSHPRRGRSPLQLASVVQSEPPANHEGMIKLHEVRRGETLSGIASYYGVNMAYLRSLNHLKNGKVKQGQHLKISADAGAESVASRPNPLKHRVMPGETLSSIAERYGVSKQAIRQANGMKKLTVMSGEMLTIPAS